jgi:Tol biopolymer transport system component
MISTGGFTLLQEIQRKTACAILVLSVLLGRLTSCGIIPSRPVATSQEIQGRIAFVSERHTQVFGISMSVTYGLYVLDLDAPDASRFVIAPGKDYLAHPTWSPLGAKLLLYRNAYDQDSGYVRRILLVDLASDQPPVVFGDAWIGRDPAWSPDGALIACVKGGALVLYDAATHHAIKDLTVPGTMADPAWSVDGRRI